MLTKLRRWFYEKWHRLNYWIEQLDACELCGNEQADSACISCNRRICCMCESGYYADESLCSECRKEITPEEYAEDCKGKAEELAEECKCPYPCDLTQYEHTFIKTYGPVKK